MATKNAEANELGELSAAQQEFLRDWFREHWQSGVRFNVHLGVSVDNWDAEGTVFTLKFGEHLSAHPEIFHGGVVASLIDTCAGGAVMAGHDYSKGSRCTTTSITVNYLSVAPTEDLRAEAVCTRRGRTTNYVEVKVYAASSDKLVAQGLVVVNVSGQRAGVEKLLARQSP